MSETTYIVAPAPDPRAQKTQLRSPVYARNTAYFS